MKSPKPKGKFIELSPPTYVGKTFHGRAWKLIQRRYGDEAFERMTERQKRDPVTGENTLMSLRDAIAEIARDIRYVKRFVKVITKGV